MESSTSTDKDTVSPKVTELSSSSVAQKTEPEDSLVSSPEAISSKKKGASTEALLAYTMTPVQATPQEKEENFKPQSKFNNMSYFIKFKVPKSENLIEDCSCCLNGPIILYGRLYISQNYMCFASSSTTKIFGTDTKEVIKLKHVLRIKKRQKYVSGIEVLLENGDQFLFSSFLNKGKTYSTLKKAWKNCVKSKYGNLSTSASLASPTASMSSSFSSSTSSLPVPKSSFTPGENESVPVQQKTPEGEEEEKLAMDPVGSASDANSKDETVAGTTSAVSSSSSSSGNATGKDEGANGSDDDRDADDEFKTIPSMYTQNNEERAGFLSDSTMVEVMAPTKIPYSPLVFFYVFFSDHAHEFEIQQPLIRKDLSIEPWKVDNENGGVTVREMRYNLALTTLKLPMGPSESRVIDKYRYVLTNDTCMVQRATVSIDIPYGDYFRTESQWTVTTQGNNEYYLSGKATTTWYKKSMLKGTIESVTIKQLKEQFQVWLKSALDYAEKKKDLIDKLNKYIEKTKADGIPQSAENGAKKKKAHKQSSSKSSKHKRQKSSKSLTQNVASAQPSKSQQQVQMQQNVQSSGGGGIMDVVYDFIDDLKAIHPVVLAVFILSLVIFVYRINRLDSKISALDMLVNAGSGNGLSETDAKTDTTN